MSDCTFTDGDAVTLEFASGNDSPFGFEFYETEADDAPPMDLTGRDFVFVVTDASGKVEHLRVIITALDTTGVVAGVIPSSVSALPPSPPDSPLAAFSPPLYRWAAKLTNPAWTFVGGPCVVRQGVPA